MPVDPRLGSVALVNGDQNAAIQQQLRDLARRVDALERATKVQTGSGAPTQAVRDGTLYVDTTNNRLYVRSGTWKFVAVT